MAHPSSLTIAALSAFVWACGSDTGESTNTGGGTTSGGSGGNASGSGGTVAAGGTSGSNGDDAAGGSSIQDASSMSSDAPAASCKVARDCPAGMSCFFAVQKPCPTEGTCVKNPEPSGATCNGIAPACTCDGETVNVICNGFPTGYYPTPIAHSGVCDGGQIRP